MNDLISQKTGENTTPHAILFVDVSAMLAASMIEGLHASTDLRFECHVTASEHLEATLDQRRWDLVIWDRDGAPQVMPDVLRTITEKNPRLPVIVLAESPTTRETVNLMRSGARGVAEKGDAGPLAEMVREELGNAQASIADPLESLQARHGHLREILDTLQDGIISITLPDRKMVYANEAFEQVFGYPAQRFPNDPEIFRHIIFPDDLDRAITAMQTCMREGLAELDHRVIWPDGQVRWVHRRAWVSFDADHRPIAITDTARDITARIEAQEALRMSEEVHRLTLINISDAVLITDPQGAFRFVCPNVHTIFGYSVAEVEALGNISRIFGDNLFDPATLDALGEIANIERRVKDKSGTDHDLLVTVKRIAIKGGTTLYTCHDITSRKQMEESLRASEERYRSLIESDDAAVSLVDYDGAYLYLNAIAAAPFGVPPEALVGKTVHDLFPPDEAASILADVQDVIKRQTGKMLRTTVTLWNRPAWFSTNIQPVRDGSGKVTAALVRAYEITALKQAEEALLIQNAILHQSHDLIALASPDGEISFMNRGGARLLGSDQPGVFLGRAVAEFYPDENMERIRHEYLPAAMRQGHWRGESRVRTLDGRLVDVDQTIFPIRGADGTILQLATIMVDITERKKIEDALRQSEARFQQFMHHLPGVVLIKSADGTTVFCNDFYAGLTGRTPAEVIGKRTSEYMPRESAVEYARENDEVLAVGRVEEFNRTFAGPDGQKKYTLTIKFPLLSENQPPLVGIISLDVTNEKRAEMALKEAHDLLEQRVVERTLELERAKDRLEAIFRHGGSSILLLNLDSGIQQANDAFGELLGVGPEGYLGKSLPSFFRADDAAAINAAIEATAESHQARSIEAQVRRPDQDVRSVEINIAPVNRSTMRVVNLVCIMHDITDRKRIETELAEKYAELDRFFTVSLDLLCIVDEKGYFVKLNRAWQTTLGYPLSMIENHRYTELIHPDDMLSTLEAGVKANQQKVVNFTNRYQTRDGEYRVLEWTSYPYGGMIYAAARDITLRRQTEDALRASEERYRTLVATMSEGILLQGRDGAVVAYNAAAERILGLSGDQLMGRAPLPAPIRTIHADGTDFPDDMQPATVALRTGIPQLSTIVGMCRDDQKVTWLLVSSQPVIEPHDTLPSAVVTTFADITDRFEAEDALRASEERFRLLIESSPVAIMIADSQGTVNLANKATAELFGYERSELLGVNLESLLPDSLIESHHQHPFAASSLLGEQPAFSLELTARRRDATTFPVDIRLSIIDTDGGGMLMTYVIDITQRKQAEEALKQALAQEKELGELKSRFVSMASHEFRTPLAAILATTETLTVYRARMTEAQIDERLDRIRQQVAHMKDIMEDVLQLAQIQADRVRFDLLKEDVDALCQEIIEEYDNQADYRGRLVYEADGSPVMAEFDTRLLRRVISNLVHNALKYSASDTRVEVRLTQDDTHFTLRVIDNGMGIPSEDLKRLFEPFHRGKNVGAISGTGLGLSITHQAVRLHGGSISVESEVGSGTTFVVVLPRVPVRSAESETADEP